MGKSLVMEIISGVRDTFRTVTRDTSAFNEDIQFHENSDLKRRSGGSQPSVRLAVMIFAAA